MLKSFKVEKLVISAIPSLVETWTLGFGFQSLEDGERRSLSNINLMVFPGTVWLKKPIFENQETSQRGGGGGHFILYSLYTLLFFLSFLYGQNYIIVSWETQDQDMLHL